ncbi:MAG: extracellular solute-binding protein [Jiangellaceae bacterium]
MKRARFLAVGIAAALALTACGDDDDTTEPEADETAAAPEPADIRVWLTPDTIPVIGDYLTATFEEQNPSSTLTIEEQPWEGLVDRVTTAATSESDTPDVVELGNTQASSFTFAGAFTDLSDLESDLGGDDLLPGLVTSGTADDKLYAAPYYAGSRIVFYRKDLLAAAGLEVPTTMDEFVEAAKALKAANPEGVDGFSGFWLPGQDWRNGQAFFWDAGGEWAVQEDGGWVNGVDTSEGIAGLTRVQDIFTNASGAPKDGNEADPVTPYCAGQVGMFAAPPWVVGQLTDGIIDPATQEVSAAGCPDLTTPEILGAFTLPGSDGRAAPVMLGGSNVGVPAASQNQELAKNVIEIMLSDEFQTLFAERGMLPAKSSLSDMLPQDEANAALGPTLETGKVTPPAPAWGSAVEGGRVLEDLFVNLANGGDVEQLAADVGAQLDGLLN